MGEAKRFPTRVVLTVATGIVMQDGLRISDMHQLVGHLAGGPVWTHQLPALRAESERAVIAAIGDAWEPLDQTREHFRTYADRMVSKLGEFMDIAPADKPFHRADAAVADAVEIMGGDASRVIVAKING